MDNDAGCWVCGAVGDEECLKDCGKLPPLMAGQNREVKPGRFLMHTGQGYAILDGEEMHWVRS